MTSRRGILFAALCFCGIAVQNNALASQWCCGARTENGARYVSNRFNSDKDIEAVMDGWYAYILSHEARGGAVCQAICADF